MTIKLMTHMFTQGITMYKSIRAVVQILFSELFSVGVFLTALGWVAKAIYGDRLSTVALFYPANHTYIESVTFSWYARRVKWRPTFGGFFVTSKGCGFMFAIGALEEDFSDPRNRAKLLAIHGVMEDFARKLRIRSVAYSGVLPSVLARAGVSREPIELARTSHWIVEAAETVRQKCGMPPDCPIVVLGAAGYLGRRVVRLIFESNSAQKIVEIDPVHSDPLCRGGEVIAQYRGRPLLLINISRRDVMERYIDLLWEGVVVLNEVYPECSASGIVRMKGLGVKYFHIQGVKAWSIPDFPGSYKGAVPCCAASAANAAGLGSSYAAQLKILEK
jgi:hypothetical protein